MAAHTDFWNGLAKDSAQILICDLQQQIVALSKTTDPAPSAGPRRCFVRSRPSLVCPLP